MNDRSNGSVGSLCLVLHAHQPYVLHHGTWPHGLEWLLEAAAETYLPLLAMLRRLADDGIALRADISFSPILVEQLSHPDFRSELPQYLQRKIVAAQEDAGFFEQAGETHLLALARHWERVFSDALNLLQALDGDLVAAFRAAEQAGWVELLTSAATHGYAPLLGTDSSLRAQLRTAVRSHERHFGRRPGGAWLPECGYRPAGPWQHPVAPAGRERTGPVERMGVEDALDEAGLRFTFVDSHLLANGAALPTDGDASLAHKSLYAPCRIGRSGVAAFPRDPRSAAQVWNARFGYPGDFQYLDFHKKRWPGGHRYWRVTGADTAMDAKLPYNPAEATERTRVHAGHFVELLAETLREARAAGTAHPVVTAPFDLELFGHWWHEGLQFIERVARVLASGDHGVKPATCGDFLAQHPAKCGVHLPEGSWGADGGNGIWLNGETANTLALVYAAELAVQEASGQPAWTAEGPGGRIARQLCRELMLMESSDWPTLITTGAARDYAERRFYGHADSFAALHDAWTRFLEHGTSDNETELLLRSLEEQDSIFSDLQPADWKP